MRLWAGLLTVVVALTVLNAQDESAPGGDSIRRRDLEGDVRFLASERLGGRLTNTDGNRRAVEFIAARFRRQRLMPAGDDGTYFHRFDLMTTALGDDNQLSVAGSEETYRLGHHFYPDPSSGSTSATGPVVFVGFGIEAPELGHDDYGSIDLTGTVALILSHEPEEYDPDSRFEGRQRSEETRVVRKVLAAQQRGAAAVLVAPDVHNHAGQQSFTRAMPQVWPTFPTRVPRYSLGIWLDQIEIPVVQISSEVAEALLGEGETFAHLAQGAEQPGGVVTIPLDGPEVAVTTTVGRNRLRNRNVVGLVEGADPTLRDEWIILTAHLDHEGEVNGRIFRGADDNASGVAALIEIAEAYALAAQAGARPDRSILFAALNSEEQGLLGAWAYTEDPLHPLQHTVAVLNMDMIGRSEEVPPSAGPRFRGLRPQTAESNRNAVNLLGYSRSPDLQAASERANRDTDLDLRFRYDNNRSNLLQRSDQWPFLYQRVPALFVHTGLHPDYHTERDSPNLLDYDKMTRIVRFVHQLSWDLAQAGDRPAYVSP